MGKKVLVVYSHPEPKSFSGGMRDTIVRSLSAAGHEVKQSDLYKQRFNPVVSKASFKDIGNKDYLNLIMEYRNAAEKGLFIDELKAEHDKLKWCDYFILVSPYWWGTVNAMLKGWIDQVIVAGVGWNFGQMYDKGLLRGKTGWIVTCTSMAENAYNKEGASGMTVEDRLHHLHWGTFKFCGADVLHPFVAYGVATAPEDVRKGFIAELEKKVKEIESAKKLYAFDPQPVVDTKPTEVKLEGSGKKGGCCYLF